MSQQVKINQPCDSTHQCESGLYCIALRDGKTKCSKCTESENSGYTSAVDNACKSEGKGYTPSGSQAYQDATASDGRVASSVIDELFTQAKNCRDRRQERENKCWDGGDDDHKRVIANTAGAIENLSSHRDQMLSSQRLFYTDRNTYQNRLSTYQDKCVRLDFNNLQQKIDAGKVALGGTEKFDCAPLDSVMSSTYDCFQAIKSLRDDAFHNVENRMPEEFTKMDSSAHQTYDKAKEIRTKAGDKSMCR
jgi:hypothetical protein